MNIRNIEYQILLKQKWIINGIIKIRCTCNQVQALKQNPNGFRNVSIWAQCKQFGLVGFTDKVQWGMKGDDWGSWNSP